MKAVDHPVVHVTEAIPEPSTTTKGQSRARDEKLARWCARTNTVLVTIDEDFRGRWARSGLLEQEGLEVINFVKEVPGLQEQHRRITLHLPTWMSSLERQPYGHRIWLQYAAGAPRLQEGKKRRPRSRPDSGAKRTMADLIERGSSS